MSQEGQSSGASAGAADVVPSGETVADSYATVASGVETALGLAVRAVVLLVGAVTWSVIWGVAAYNRWTTEEPVLAVVAALVWIAPPAVYVAVRAYQRT